MRIEFGANTKCKNGKKRLAAQFVCDNAAGPEELVYSWVDERRRICVLPGTETETGRQMVMFSLLDEEDELGFGTVPASVVRKAFQHVQPVSDAIKNRVYECKNKDIVVDEDWFTKRDERLKPEWNEEYSAEVISPEGAVELALSYALSGGGQGMFERQGKSADKQLISADFHFTDEQSGRGWGEGYYVISP